MFRCATLRRCHVAALATQPPLPYNGPCNVTGPATAASRAPAATVPGTCSTSQTLPRNDPGTCSTSQILPRNDLGTCSTSQILPRAILVPVPRHKSCPRTILVLDPGNDQEYFKGSIRITILLLDRSWYLIQATTRNTLRGQSGERSWSRTILVLDASNDQEYFKGDTQVHISIDSTYQSG